MSYMSDMEERKKTYRRKRTLTIGGAIAAIILILVIVSNTASFRRTIKSFTSDFTGGIPRVVSVYDQSGNLLRTYEGIIDVQENTYGNKVLFDLDGKRYVIYNAIVIAEETDE